MLRSICKDAMHLSRCIIVLGINIQNLFTSANGRFEFLLKIIPHCFRNHYDNVEMPKLTIIIIYYGQTDCQTHEKKTIDRISMYLGYHDLIQLAKCYVYIYIYVYII